MFIILQVKSIQDEAGHVLAKDPAKSSYTNKQKQNKLIDLKQSQ
jgi:hypothetical protein